MAEHHKAGDFLPLSESSNIEQALIEGFELTQSRDITLDQLSYMSDLIDEFREMAQSSHMETLAGILSLAFLEANRQIATRRKAAS